MLLEAALHPRQKTAKLCPCAMICIAWFRLSEHPPLNYIIRRTVGENHSRAMIYDVNSPQFQQFLRSSGRRKEGYEKTSSLKAANKQTSKPAGAASTGL